MTGIDTSSPPAAIDDDITPEQLREALTDAALTALCCDDPALGEVVFLTLQKVLEADIWFAPAEEEARV